MALECSGGSKLAELVTNHILSYIYRNVLASVMDCKCVTYKIRENC